jgi:hypothetical protein
MKYWLGFNPDQYLHCKSDYQSLSEHFYQHHTKCSGHEKREYNCMNAYRFLKAAYLYDKLHMLGIADTDE